MEINFFSQWIAVDPTHSIDTLEAYAQYHHFTLGYQLPHSHQTSLQEALQKKMPNLYSLVYGELEDLCIALELESKGKKFYTTAPVPRQATGPNWKNFLLGSQQKFGTFKKATLKLFPLPFYIFNTVVELESEVASLALEQQLRNQELFPQCFARITKTNLSKSVASLFENKFLLVLQWSLSESALENFQKALAHVLNPYKSHHFFVENPVTEELKKKLHENYPNPAWAGIPIKKHASMSVLEKEITSQLNLSL